MPRLDGISPPYHGELSWPTGHLVCFTPPSCLDCYQKLVTTTLGGPGGLMASMEPIRADLSAHAATLVAVLDAVGVLLRMSDGVRPDVSVSAW